MFSKFPHVIACVGISFLLCLSNMDVGLPGGSEVKNPLASAGDTDSIPGSGRSPGEGNGIFAWEMPVDRGSWWATVHGIFA